jgi:hypothetical protein
MAFISFSLILWNKSVSQHMRNIRTIRTVLYVLRILCKYYYVTLCTQ